MTENETQARLREIERVQAVHQTELQNIKSDLERLSTKEEVAHIKDDVKGILNKSWFIVSSIVMLAAAAVADLIQNGGSGQ